MDFYERVKIVLEDIPQGRVATYGQIALLCGKPQNSRQVGYALNRGMAGKDAPAYRVVNSRGILSGAAAFDTPDMQRRLLEKEGIEVLREKTGWRVDLKQYGWRQTLDDVEKFHTLFKNKKI